MLASLEINNSFVSDIYMDDISKMIRQLRHLHLEQSFIRQKHDLNFLHLCQHYCVSTSSDPYLLVQGKYPTLYVG